MPPRYVEHGGEDWPYLFMYFHDEAWIVHSNGTGAPAKGKAIIWSPGAQHQYGHLKRRWCHSWLSANGAAIDEAVAANRVPMNRLFSIGGDQAFLKYLRMIYDELHRHAARDTYMLEGLMQLWIRDMARTYRAEGKETVPQSVEASRQFIEANLQRRVRLEELANVAHLSVSRFSELFRTHYGVSPMHYLQEFRMRRAALLLADSNLAVHQVAAMVGYDDPLHFSKQFRKHYGSSPKAFRHR